MGASEGGAMFGLSLNMSVARCISFSTARSSTVMLFTMALPKTSALLNSVAWFSVLAGWERPTLDTADAGRLAPAPAGDPAALGAVEDHGRVLDLGTAEAVPMAEPGLEAAPPGDPGTAPLLERGTGTGPTEPGTLHLPPEE